MEQWGIDKPITNLLLFVAVFRVLDLAVLDKCCTNELSVRALMHECMCASFS